VGFAGNSEIYDFSKYFDFTKSGNCFAWEKNYSLKKLFFSPPEKHFQKRTQNSESFAPKKSLSEIEYVSFLCVITIWKVKMAC
jgi:hypothetical protein